MYYLSSLPKFFIFSVKSNFNILPSYKSLFKRVLGCIFVFACFSSYSAPFTRSLSPVSLEKSNSTSSSVHKYYSPENKKKLQEDTTQHIALHLALFPESKSHQWGESPSSVKAISNIGLTAYLDNLNSFVDQFIRVELTAYGVKDEHLNKVSFIPVFIFPDIASQFPLYLGAGMGASIFSQQIKNESIVALDYQLFTGIRLLSPKEPIGLFVEAGLKNHIHILSDGQLNSSYLSGGLVWSF